MIEAHVLDSWTLPSERDSLAFGYLNLLGGFAAPLFLWLAGLALVLSAERARTRTGDPREPDRAGAAALVMRRGFEIFLLAFLFRLQAFIVSPGNPLVSLLRVDILNIMGPSMMGAGLLWRAASGPRSAAVSVRRRGGRARDGDADRADGAGGSGRCPPLVQWYMSPSGNHSTFTLFPWSGFVFAGAACGALLAMTDAGREGRGLWHASRWPAHWSLVVRPTPSLLPSIYSTSSFWTTSPTYFGLRVGLLMMAVGRPVRLAPLAAHLPRAVSRACALWPPFAVCLLDSRGTRVRLRDGALAPPAATLGHGCRLHGVCLRHVLVD